MTLSTATPTPSPSHAADDTPIALVMTRDPVTVHPELGIEDLVGLLLEQNISRVPVVDDAGQLIGIVSKSDVVVDHYVRGDTEVDQRGAVEPNTHVHELGGVVRDVMTPAALSVPATMSVGATARRMLADNVHAFPVIGDDGRLVGMVTTTDIVAWVARL